MLNHLGQTVDSMADVACLRPSADMVHHTGGGATNTIFKVFDLTRPGMELAIYRTQCEHANHYTTVYTSHVRVLYSFVEISLLVSSSKF
jgi:hypothetical protein